MIKLYHIPDPTRALANPNMGIHQVIAQLHPFLSSRYEFVGSEAEADIVIAHAGSYTSLSRRGNDGKPKACSKPLIAVCHGLHPTGQYPQMGEMHYKENRDVLLDIVQAAHIIVPSHWVAEIIERNFKRYPTVIHWGVNLADWVDAEPLGYVLWNKNRADLVCNPEPMNQAAHRLPDVQFISTYGHVTPNVKVTGGMPFEQMKKLIRGASVYLATTKETGDIGSREALACGVPVVAFRQGGVLDVVQHGVNGYLAEVGNADDLAKGIRYCLTFRETLSRNAKQLAQGYGWERAAEQVSVVIDNLYHDTRPQSIDISVIIPCHNYGNYVSEAIQSVLAQQTSYAVEVIVVDDASTDNSWEVIQGFPQVRAYRHEQNQGVANTRNHGISEAHGRFILCLDADDVLLPNALQVLAASLEANAFLAITYGRLALYGTEQLSNWLTAPFDADKQVDGSFNQVPSCCMYRKADFLRVGGYRTRYEPTEDADLWARLVAWTGKTAALVTNSATYAYRLHEGSLSQTLRRNPHKDLGGLALSLKPLGMPPIRNKVYPYDKAVVRVEVVGTGNPLPTLDSLDSQTTWQWTTRGVAPLVLRLEAGTILEHDFIRQALSVGDFPADDGITKGVIMCCGGSVRARITESDLMNDANFTKVRIMKEGGVTLDSPTRQKVSGTVLKYRGAKGDTIYIHNTDLAFWEHTNYFEEVKETVIEFEAVMPAPPPPVPPLELVAEAKPHVSRKRRN